MPCLNNSHKAGLPQSDTFLYNSLPGGTWGPFITPDPDLPREIRDERGRGLCLFILYLCDYNSL